MAPTSSTELLAGRYALGAHLGHGGMGEVREARDVRLEREVAIKLLLPELSAQAEVRRRFEREARAAARVSHPNVVAVFDTGEDDGSPYIVMERLPGTTLADEIARGPLDPGRAGRLALEIVSALDAAHRFGVIHRDIKPGNILLARDGGAKVGDFGIATIVEGTDLTTTGLLIGTTAYLAPERLAGAPATASSDLYGAGIVLFEALAGRPPFRADTPLALVAAITSGDTPSLRALRPDVPPALVAVTERAMANDPRDRFESASEMATALEEATGSTPMRTDAAPTVRQELTAERPAPPHPVLSDTEVAPVAAIARSPAAPPARRRHRMAVAVATVALALLLVVSVVAVLATRDGGGSGSVPPTAATTGTTAPATAGPIPQPLDRALDRLDRAVSP